MPLNIVTADTEGPTTPDPPKASDAPAGSVLARLRERAASQRRDQTLDVPIAAWDDQLVIRYRMPPMEEADRLMATGARLLAPDTGPAPSMTNAAVELMATCAITVLGVDQDGTVEDLKVKLTGQLLTMLGLPLPPGVDQPGDVTVREVIAALFNGNWLAVNVHAAKVMDWLQGGGGELGEASAAT
jgi:hypothetical protein